MQVFRRVPRGSQRVIPATATQSQSWLSAQDMDLLAKQLDKMRKPVKNAFTAGSATNRFILSVPPEQMQERLFQVMSVYNLVHALILSGLIGVALTPLDPDNFGEGKASMPSTSLSHSCWYALDRACAPRPGPWRTSRV